MLLETLLPMFALLGLATLLQTLSGFGFGLMVVSSFTLFNILPLTATTFVVCFLSLFNSVSLVARNIDHINKRAFTLLLVSGIPFMALGYALLEYLSAGMTTWLNLLLGVAILSCCGLLLVKRKQATPSERAYGFSIAGALGGLLGGLFSTFGPPVVFQCYRFSEQFLSNLSKIKYLAFFITFGFVVSLAKIVTLTTNIVYKKSAQYRKYICMKGQM